MAWSNEAAKAAKAIMMDGGSIFPDLEEAGSRKFSDLQEGKVYNLGRFEVIKLTQKQNEPFVTLELSGRLFSGYARAIANQLIEMTKAASLDPDNEAYDNDRKAWSAIDTDLAVTFAKRTSPKGVYWCMEVGAEDAAN